jgi:hypothetical protein
MDELTLASHAKLPFFLILSALLCSLTSCSSISEGVAKTMLEHKSEDNRQCAIVGESFTGVRQALDQQKSHDIQSVKIMTVHGIGEHLPGYANRLREKLAKVLGLNVLNKQVKQIELANFERGKTDPNFNKLGKLLVYRYTNQSHSKELLFYELTWSPITEDYKELLKFDNANADSFQRTQLNQSLKSFMNSTIPDLLIYMGNRHKYFQEAGVQSICWMLHGDWGNLPQKGKQTCNIRMIKEYNNINHTDYFMVTHSLGSRIMLDSFDSFIETISKHRAAGESHDPSSIHFEQSLREKEVTVFMLANQLPLLQVALKDPKVTNNIPHYCSAHATKVNDRILGKLRLIAFSDPNDILSYSIPPEYVENYIDSRLCPEVDNVFINIASVNTILGAIDFADPITAHSGYQEDDRIINIIANGVNQPNASSSVTPKCYWTKIEE